MGRPSLPKNVHILSGSAKKHPDRMKKRENEPENANPIGEPPSHLSEAVKGAWSEIVSTSIDGVLGEADRIAVELAAGLLVKCRGLEIETVVDGKVIKETVFASAAEQNQLFRYLSQFGMTPADRSKISLPGQKKKNLFDDE